MAHVAAISPLEYSLAGIFDMRAHGAAGAVLVLCLDGLEHAAMLLLPPENAAARLNERQVAVEIDANGDLLPQRRQRLDKEPVAARLRNRAVEEEIFLDTKAALAPLGDHRIQPGQHLLNAAQALPVPITGGEGRGITLDGHPEHEAALDVGDATDRREVEGIGGRAPRHEPARTLA